MPLALSFPSLPHAPSSLPLFLPPLSPPPSRSALPSMLFSLSTPPPPPPPAFSAQNALKPSAPRMRFGPSAPSCAIEIHAREWAPNRRTQGLIGISPGRFSLRTEGTGASCPFSAPH